jgi:hypothetical protein
VANTVTTSFAMDYRFGPLVDKASRPFASMRLRTDRYDQLRNIFKHKVGPEGLPDPNDQATFELAKLPWALMWPV